MIRFSNGHAFKYMTPSGSLGFKGLGYFWERPLVKLGIMNLDLFTIVLRTLTREPRLYPISNLSWRRPGTWLPWSSHSCVQFLPNGGVGNKVGLWNHGINYWCNKTAPKVPFHRLRLVGSIFGNKRELMEMTRMLNQYEFVGLEVNVSCMNVGHETNATEEVVDGVKAVKVVSRHPIIVKVSVDQDYLAIAQGLAGMAEAISLNSVPWNIAFPDLVGKSPFYKIGRPGTGEGGVSGKPAQQENWKAVEALAEQGVLPVIGPSIMEYEDLVHLREIGANAFSFGAIHCRTPWKPTSIVERDEHERHSAYWEERA